MTGWLVRNIGALVLFSSVGAVGGSINYLTTKEKKEEIIQTIEEGKENLPNEKQTQEIIERNSQARRAKGPFCRRVSLIYGNSGDDESRCERRLRNNGYIR
ncbi:hypothetical protein [Candidatus Mycoplasma haematobovis]|uniref:hypothetical protein n=1 Tax=Candidatus Mycoplasma haematobovis TaxID=432608 RepID=UPI001650C21B|nr:hypothetical protein [Candidatus Mycoplasma haematobovis]